MVRLLCVLAIAAPAFAAPIPAPIETMIRSAKPGERATVAKVAKRAAADSGAEIDALVASLTAAEAEAEQAALADQGFWDGWTGEGALGGTFSTGNTEETGLSASIGLNKRGLDWEHDFQLSADYLETNGDPRRERFHAGYTGRRDLSGKAFFAFGLLSFERDRFGGIDYRFTESLGMGYRLADSDSFQWTVEGGPAARQTKFSDGTTANRIDLLGKTDVDWKISDTLRLTESAGFLASGGNSSLYAKTALTAKVMGDLSARLSYDILHETDPPAGREKTDTITRASLVYGF
ncbi:DUF481 domain-containing protein [Pacificimonas sp. WHA3]|uniref:DUF481 domain-containing protein n=1 Tax=Pacificimonas pallii TaxID=2827236 RepID=A0ABS6SAY2_9SPHN|nr:DUF481 domain-containing protein [Pacificimonas pallii]MBV7255568.1 DUF481 domain-containing protein [Pacificimonas pallii]